MHADGLLHSQHWSRRRKENRQGTDSAQPSPAPRAALDSRELHLHVLPALTDCAPCARWGDLKDFVPALDINYEQGALGVTHLASECSRRLGSLLGGMKHGRKERGKENLLSANALESVKSLFASEDRTGSPQKFMGASQLWCQADHTAWAKTAAGPPVLHPLNSHMQNLGHGRCLGGEQSHRG